LHRAKPYLIGAGVVLALLAVTYGAGRLQTASRIEAAQGETKKAEGERDQAREELREARRVIEVLEARRALHRALVALDERNFGIAQQKLEQAGALLAKGDKELEALGKAISAYRLLATEDVGAQRTRVLVFATKLDELVPPPNP
jgi:cellobiose-specific phosphotransferase system component IIA